MSIMTLSILLGVINCVKVQHGIHKILTSQASLLQLFTKATLCCYLFYITCNSLMKIFHNELFHKITQENELPDCFPRYNIPEPQKRGLQDFNLLFRVDLARAGCSMLCPARFCHNLCEQPVPVSDPPLQQNVFPIDQVGISCIATHVHFLLSFPMHIFSTCVVFVIFKILKVFKR